jgi:hypothetical protein
MRGIFTVVLTVFALGVRGQDKAKPEFLKGPAGWEFERFALPPAFSPGFPYAGVEELRFSPGMFKKDSADYFSYAFVARLDNTSSFTEKDVRHYLLVYFKGLCASTAKQRNLSVDTSRVAVAIEKGGISTYGAVLQVFGVFADGGPVTLHAEINVVFEKDGQKTYLVFIASPQPKTDAIWGRLREIQKGFSVGDR